MIFLLFFVFSSSLYSQELIIDFPSIGSQNITKDPTFQISLTNGYQFIEDNTPSSFNRDSLVYDSLNNIFNKALIDIFPTEHYNGHDSTVYYNMGGIGYGDYTTPYEFSFESHQFLKYNATYGLRFFGLLAYNSITNDTVRIDTIFDDVFTCTNPPVELLNTTIDGSMYITCNQELIVNFSEPILNLYPNGNPIISLDSIVANYDSSNVLIDYEINDISSTLLYNSLDSTSILIVPNDNLNYKYRYNMSINLGDYSGDTSQYYNLPFYLKNKSKVTIKASIENSDSIYSDLIEPLKIGSEFFVSTSDTLYLKTPLVKNNCVFKEWFCPEYPMLISDANNNRIMLDFNCDEIGEYDIFAVYQRIPMDTLTLIPDIYSSTGSVIGRSNVNNFNDSLGNGKYTYQRFGAETETCITTEMDPGYQLSHWTSSNPDYNNVQTYSICLNNTLPYNGNLNANSDAGGSFGGLGDPIHQNCSTMVVNFYLNGVDLSRSELVGIFSNSYIIYNSNQIPVLIDIQNGTNGLKGEVTLPVNGFQTIDFELILTTLNDCYEIETLLAKQYGSYQGRWGSKQPKDAVGNSFNNTIYLDQNIGCESAIIINMRNTIRYLTLEEVIKNEKPFPESKIFTIDIFDNQGNQLNPRVVSSSSVEKDFPGGGLTIKETTVYEFSCNQEVKLVPKLLDNSKGYVLNLWLNSTLTNDVNDNDLVDSPIEYGTQNTLLLTLDGNKRCRFQYDVKFRIEQIGARNKDGNFRYWHVDNGWPALYDQVVGMIITKGVKPGYGDLIFKTGQIAFIFNHPLDLTSIKNQGVYVYDESINLYDDNGSITPLRYDKNLPQTYYANDDAMNYIDYNTNENENSNAFILTLENEHNMLATHMDVLNIRITNEVKNIIGVPLSNPFDAGDGSNQKLQLTTDYPSLQLTFDGLYFTENPDKWFGNAEIGCHQYYAYEAKVATAINPNEIVYNFIKSEPDGSLPSQNGYDWSWDGIYYQNYIESFIPHGFYRLYLANEKKLLIQPLAHHGLVKFGFQNYEVDGGHQFDELIGNIAPKIFSFITEQYAPDWAFGDLLNQFANDISTGWFDDDDSFIGKNNHHLDFSNNLWEAGQLYRLSEKRKLPFKNGYFVYRVLLY